VSPVPVARDTVVSLKVAMYDAHGTLIQAPGEPPRVMAWGRYIDHFRREGRAWRIASRVCETEAVAADA